MNGRGSASQIGKMPDGYISIISRFKRTRLVSKMTLLGGSWAHVHAGRIVGDRHSPAMVETGAD